MGKLYRQYIEFRRKVEDYTVGAIVAALLERRARLKRPTSGTGAVR